jgi:serine/threonine protein kinase
MGILKIQSALRILGSNKLSLDFFEKIGILGSGGFSTVWKVKCNKISQLFAIKQISKSQIKTQNYLDLILNEKNIMKDLYFPLISNLYCTFQDDSNLYFVLDYFSGGDLRYYLYKGKQFSENCLQRSKIPFRDFSEQHGKTFFLTPDNTALKTASSRSSSKAESKKCVCVSKRYIIYFFAKVIIFFTFAAYIAE